MEIPANDYSDKELVQKTVERAIDKLNESGYFFMCWVDYPKWLANKVTDLFVAKGYHASTQENMGPSGWFWYGNAISKKPIDPVSYQKSVKRVIA